jgi:DNA processing protein
MTDIHPADPRLPERLRQLTRPCRTLTCAGDPSALMHGTRIGIIGSRRPRADSEQHARRIAGDAARLGFTVVSGLAIGIDGIAHRAAIQAGGDTVAVLAGGLRHVHPARNRDLARTIAGSASQLGVVAGPGVGGRGVVVTEYGGGDDAAHAHRFLERNRIIAALSDYLVVVQAGMTSGSMVTAQHALELGVPIGIVPSAPSDREYEGSIGLVRDGADCVVDGKSLAWRLEIHGIVRPGFTRAAFDGEQTALIRIPEDHPLAAALVVPRAIEDVAEFAGLDLRDTRRLLVELEEDGLVAHRDDGLWTAATL